MKLRYQLVALLIAIGIAATPSVSDACTCTWGSALEELAARDAVFTALALVVTHEGVNDIVLAVPFQYWKGTMAQTVTIVTYMAGSCGYTFQQGETYLVFAFDGPCPDGIDEPCFHTDLCTRNNPLSAAQADLDELGPGLPVPVESVSWGVIKKRYEE